VYKTELSECIYLLIDFTLKKDLVPTKRTIVAKVDKKKNELDKDKERDNCLKNRIIHEKEILYLLYTIF